MSHQDILPRIPSQDSGYGKTYRIVKPHWNSESHELIVHWTLHSVSLQYHEKRLVHSRVYFWVLKGPQASVGPSKPDAVPGHGNVPPPDGMYLSQNTSSHNPKSLPKTPRLLIVPPRFPTWTLVEGLPSMADNRIEGRLALITGASGGYVRPFEVSDI